MGTTKEDIRTWLKEGKSKGATHTIIVCDTFDHEDYPVHVMPGVDVRKESQQYQTGMQRIMEVYSHALDHEAQMSEGRSFHWEYPVAEVTSPPSHVSDMVLVLSSKPTHGVGHISNFTLKGRGKKGSPAGIDFELAEIRKVTRKAPSPEEMTWTRILGENPAYEAHDKRGRRWIVDSQKGIWYAYLSTDDSGTFHRTMRDAIFAAEKRASEALKLEPGMEIYIPTAWYIDRGEDDIQGGLATIEKIETRGRHTWVSVKEAPGRSYNLEHLLTVQEKLKVEFGENRARVDPDLGQRA